MIKLKDFERACGGVFTTRQKVAAALQYKDPHSVDKFLYGLERLNGNRYLTADVYNRLIENGLS